MVEDLPTPEGCVRYRAPIKGLHSIGPDYFIGCICFGKYCVADPVGLQYPNTLSVRRSLEWIILGRNLFVEPAGKIQDCRRQRSYIAHELREKVGYVSVFLPCASLYEIYTKGKQADGPRP